MRNSGRLSKQHSSDNSVQKKFIRNVTAVLVCVMVALPLLGFVQSSEAQQRRALLTAYELRDGFQGDGLGQWASYPTVQDVGYEPSLSPTLDQNLPGRRTLMRVVKLNRVGPQRFGFIKKVRMILTAESRLRFAYGLRSPEAAEIEVGLAGTDGQLYAMRFPAKPDLWNAVQLSLPSLRAPAGTSIEAVYIVANVPKADPDFTYRFLIRGVSLNGAREARFEVTTPRTAAIDPWTSLVSAKSYQRGETLALEARSPAKLTTAECVLETQTGQAIATERLYDDGTHGDKTAGDSVWTNDQLRAPSPSDPAGVWLARLRGTTSNGESIATDVRLLVRSDSNGTHPRLFFGPKDREKLIARIRDPKLASTWADLLNNAKFSRGTGDLAHGGETFELLDSEYLLPSLTGYFDILNRARFRISYNALEAYLTGNADARAAAKGALLDVARWPHWAPPWFRAHGQHTYYPAGQLSADVALGYDLLYDDLSEPERALIRKALIEKSIIPTFKEYVADNRVMANTSNWIAHTVGGALIAASAIADDLTLSEREGDFEIYVGGLMRKLEDHMAASYLADGSYGEGISYHEFDAETLGPALVALQRAFGVDYWKQTHVLESLTYPLYTLVQPFSATPDMGDTHPPAGHGIPAIVYESKDPVMRWYYGQFDRPAIAKFIFYDDSVAPAAPTLPTSRIFETKGDAVFRSGWSSDATVLLFRAGPNFNHHHADQGSFLLSAFGEVLIGEAGWSDYYKDPYYATFFTQAVGHNTILVGDDPESQTIPDTLQFKALNRYPRITDSLTSEFYDGVGSELSSVYRDRLASYSRRIVYLKPDYFVVFDNVKTNAKTEQLDLLLHVPNRDKLKLDGLSAIYTAEKASLAVRSFPSTATKASVKEGHIPYPVFSTRTPAETPAQPAYLDFQTVTPVSEAQFVTAIVPAKTESAAVSLIKQITEITGANIRGLRVLRGSKTDLVLFRIGPAAKSISEGKWSMDAASLVVTESGAVIERFAIQDARWLRQGERTLFSSAVPLSVAVRMNPKELVVVCNATTATKVTLFVGSNPARITIDDKDLGTTSFSFDASAGTVSFEVPSGQHELKIWLR